jgi:hypothetical protein
MLFVNHYKNIMNQHKVNLKKQWNNFKIYPEILKLIKTKRSNLKFILRDSSDSDYSGDEDT